jgi:hypothetical protein
MKTYSHKLEQTSVADKQRLETERRKAMLDQQAADREQERQDRDAQLKAEQKEREADRSAAQEEREKATLRQKLQRLEQER